MPTGRTPEFLKKYNYMFEDPKINYNPRLTTMDMFIEMQRFATNNAENAKTPHILITAG